MKRAIKRFIVILLVIISVSFSDQKGGDNFNLTVKVNHLRNSNGVVQFTIYNKDGSIPDEKYRKYF